MKVILGTLAAAMIAGVAFAQPAEARCMWNGYAWECFHPGPHYGWWRGRHEGWRDHDHWRHHAWRDRDWGDWR